MTDALNNQLDAYLDGSLTEAERGAFESRLKTDSALRAAVTQQAAINEALKRAIPRPSDSSLQSVLAQIKSSAAQPVSTQHSRGAAAADSPSLKMPMRRRLAIAAVFACGLVGVWQIWSYCFPTSSISNPGSIFNVKLTSPEEYYNTKLANYEPYWVCENDQQFAQTFRDRVGQAILLKKLPANITCKGLDYCEVVSDSTVAALMLVDGKEVIALIDRANLLTRPAMRPGCDLNVFTRQIDDLIVIEISPFDQPHVMDLFFNPDKPADARQGQS